MFTRDPFPLIVVRGRRFESGLPPLISKHWQ